MKVVLRLLSSIKPYPGNPRKNNAAIEPVAHAIRQFGFRQPIVVDAEGVIVVGHTRFYAAQKLGLKRVPVHVARDMSAEQLRAYRIADNKLHELSKWDEQLLSLELEELRAGELDFSLESLGFSEAELGRLIGDAAVGGTDPDDIPEPPDQATTKPGELWILGQHRLLCGDSSQPEDVDRLCDGLPIHMVNSDPPYNVKVEPRSNNAIAFANKKRTHHQNLDLARDPKKQRKTTDKLRAKDRALANDFLPAEEFERMLLAWFGNMGRHLIEGGAFYIWGGYANLANYPLALAASQLYFAQAIILVKEHPVMTRKDFMGNHEWAFYGWREGAAHRYFGPKNVTDVWEFTRKKAGSAALGRGLRLESADGSRLDVRPPGPGELQTVRVSDEGLCVYGQNNATDVWSVKKVCSQRMVHLTEKPTELALRAMRYSTRKGEHVLDLFGGSGSTLIAAEQAGRRAFLMELDPLYCDVIITRWERFTGRKAKRWQRSGAAKGENRRARRRR